MQRTLRYGIVYSVDKTADNRGYSQAIVNRIKTDIGSNAESGRTWSVARQVLCRLRLVDDELAPVTRALVASFACLPVAYLLLLWGDSAGNAYVGFAGVIALLIAEVIWMILIVIVGWKLSRTVVRDLRSGRFGRPGKGKTETQ